MVQWSKKIHQIFLLLFSHSFPSCQGIYHHHNITYPHNQMQMYISAPPQGFQYPPPNHANTQPPAPPFVPGTTYQSMPHPPMPPQGYPMQCAPNVQPFMMPQQPHNQVSVQFCWPVYVASIAGLNTINNNQGEWRKIISIRITLFYVLMIFSAATIGQCSNAAKHAIFWSTAKSTGAARNEYATRTAVTEYEKSTTSTTTTREYSLYFEYFFSVERVFLLHIVS